MNTTDTIYRVWKDTGDVIALFPAEPGTHDPYTCQSYMHVGQHGAADPYGVMRATRKATEAEYADLDRELRTIGYMPRVVLRMGRHYLAVRCRALLALYS